MSFRIVVDFWQPAFHGLAEFGRPAWPPEPFRLSQALMAGCHRPFFDGEARSALQALTELGNPLIVAPAATEAHLPGTYTHRSGGPMGDKNITGRDLERILDMNVAGLAATNRTEKPRGQLLLDDCRVVYELSDPQKTVNVEALDRAARRVPYLGRSQDGCDITVTTDDVSMPSPLARSGVTAATYPAGRWSAVGGSGGKTRGWAANSCEWMDLNHAAWSGGSQLPPFSPEPYLTRLTYAVRKRPVPFEGGRVMVVPTKVAVPSPQIPAFMEQLTTSALPVFPCVVAGHRYADGRLCGVGIISDDPEQRRSVAVELQRRAGMSGGTPTLTSQTENAEYWQRSARRWSSATPLRAFPDERVADWTIAKEAEEVTGQQPTIAWFKTPQRPWHRVWPQPSDGLGLWWAELQFDEPVRGPLRLGRTVELGFGLFVPEAPR